ncbi:MAG TPA: type II secretion system F family protein [Acidimicrobiales bacterium]|nr:type II secretion system F family protein [Acidimicrobiales bacterium]
MLAVAIVAVFAASSLLVYAMAMKADERVGARTARARLADYGDAPTTREGDLLAPLADRVVRPTAGWVVGLVKRVVPGEYVARTHHRLVLAGRASAEELDRFLVVRVLMVVAVPVGWLLVSRLGSLSGFVLFSVMAFIGLVGVLGPDAWLNRAVDDRCMAMRKKLPDVLDLLTISVEAGLGFDQALARTVTMVPGPLSEEFQRTLGEMRAGATRGDALKNLDARTEIPELRSFVLALQQADTFGVSIGSILRSQAAEMRVRRHQMAQEQAQKAPVKMLIPMVFCIMPALFVVIAGPAALSIYHLFAGH